MLHCNTNPAASFIACRQPKGYKTMARNFLHTAYDRMVTARERQVRRYVNGALLQLDDDSLKILGRSREEINREGYQTYFF